MQYYENTDCHGNKIFLDHGDWEVIGLLPARTETSLLRIGDVGVLPLWRHKTNGRMYQAMRFSDLPS